MPTPIRCVLCNCKVYPRLMPPPDQIRWMKKNSVTLFRKIAIFLGSEECCEEVGVRILCDRCIQAIRGYKT